MSGMIEIKNLTKRFGKVAAVDRLSLTIEAGEFLVLLGPSGCGKTTLMRCIAGLEEPDEGEIVINGQLVFSADRGVFVPPGQRQVGMVFQSYALWPHMTVYDNIGYGLRLKKIPREEAYRRVDEVLHALSMDGLGKRYPFELSGGQQQRVALARLLATKPPVFLMDEPLSNLDARLRVDMRSELKRLHFESKATTIYVTHDQTEALTMATRVAVMKDGILQQVAPPMELYRQPANLFVAEFVGMPRVNLIPARVVQHAGEQWLDAGPLRLPSPGTIPQKDLVVAVRPEDIQLSLEAQANSVEFRVYAVLPAGPDQFIDVQCDGIKLVVRETRYLDLKMDQPVYVTVDPAAITLYDKATGQLLLSGDGDCVNELRAG